MLITIDPELQAFITPLTASEYADLRKSIERDGVLEPLDLWDAPKDGVMILIDGHNRYEIATKLGLPYEVRIVNGLADRDAVKRWMFDRQIARRNLGTAQAALLAAMRGIDNERGTSNQRRLAQLLAESTHEKADEARRGVLNGVNGLRSACNSCEIDRKPPRSRAPAAQRPAHTDVNAARERIDHRATATDVRKLQAKLVEVEKAADFYSRLHVVPSIKVNTSRPKSGKRAACPVTMASDWHVGEVVSSEETMGRNTYDLKEARRRAANFWDNVLWLRKDAQHSQACDDHVLWLGGDLISGSIHPELSETNEVPLADQVSEAVAMVKPGIEALAAECRRVIIPCNHGNHGRITTKSRIKTGWANSLEVLLYRHLKDSLGHLDNLEWHIPRAENLMIEVMGYKVQCQHGTQIRSQGGIGGILVPLTRWAARAASAHYYIFGHFHQAHCFDQVIVNGSLIGDSAYSRANAMSYREPEQVNFVIDARRGLRRFDPVSVK